ncbi:MAG: NAD(P)-binding domain-containing protein [Pseudomonadota bacterium]
MNTTIGVVGAGTIATPMVRSLLRRFPDISIVLSPRSVHVGERLSAEDARVQVAPDNQGVLDASKIVLLCMMQDVAREVLPALSFHSDHRLVTVMVDYSVEDLLVDCYPATDIELTMPLPFIETGGCPLPCYPTAHIVRELYGDDNDIVELDRIEAMAPHVAVSGVVSAFMQSVDEVGQWLGQQTGDAVAAESHVVKMLVGYLKSVKADGADRLKDEMKNLSTRGGLNAQFRQNLNDAQVYLRMHAELDALLKRLTQPSS